MPWSASEPVLTASAAAVRRSTCAPNSGWPSLAWSPLPAGLTTQKELAIKHPAFAEVADEVGVSAQRVALAWELAQSPVVIPIPGAKRPASITDSAAAAELQLSVDQLARLDED